MPYDDDFTLQFKKALATLSIRMAHQESWRQDAHKPLFKRSISSFFCVFVLFYLGFHTVRGDHGALALFRESRKLELLTTQLDSLKSETAILEKKVKLLSNEALDLDMLDEQARLVLGMAGKNEAVIFLEKPADQ